MKKGENKKKIPIMTPQEKVFADKYIETGKIKKSAEIAFPDQRNPSNKGQITMQKDIVREYIHDNAMGAMERIVRLSEKSRNEMVRLSANKDIMDRAGYKPQEAAVNINIPLYLPPEVLEKYRLDSQNNQ